MDVQTDIAPDVAARKHKWGDPMRLQGRTERTCAHCEIVKITMHPPHGLPWREWRHPDNPVSFQMTNTPPCLDRGAPA